MKDEGISAAQAAIMYGERWRELMGEQRFTITIDGQSLTFAGDRQQLPARTVKLGETLTVDLGDGRRVRLYFEDTDFIPQPEGQKTVARGTRVRLKREYPLGMSRLSIPGGREGEVIKTEQDRGGILLQVVVDNYGGNPIWINRENVEVL